MAFENDEYGRRTLDFVERLRQLSNYEDIKNLVVDELEWYGLNFVTSWSMPGPGDGMAAESSVVLNTRPLEFLEQYVVNGYGYCDPVLAELRDTHAPFTWGDVLQKRRLNKAEQRVMAEAKNFGADDGLIVPIVSANGSVSIFSPCGRKPNLSRRARSALEIIGLYSHHALHRALLADYRERQKKSTPLTPREREIMKWVATGKTDDEIADILKIGRETVTTHVENAKRKLNAARRTYAVVQALRFGEIAL